jgi:hypothetical protein
MITVNVYHKREFKKEDAKKIAAFLYNVLMKK